MSSTDVSTPLSPKQCEIRQRESRILDTAYPLVRQHGLSGISMDAIARQMGLTRGTIYNHFANKEEIILALATRAVRRRISLFHFAMSLGKSSRERCAAIGIAAEVYVDAMPDDFAMEQAVRHDPVWQKTSSRRREVMAHCESACIHAISGLVDVGVRDEERAVPRGTTLDQLRERVVFGLWSLCYGGLLLESTSPSLARAGIHEPRQTIRANCNSLLDQVGWAPTHQPRSYNAFVKRISPHLSRHAQAILTQDPSSAPLESDRRP